MLDLPLRIASALVKYRYLMLACTVLSTVALPQWSAALGQTAQDGRIVVAETADDKKKKAKPDPKTPPKAPPKAPPQTQPKAPQQGQPKAPQQQGQPKAPQQQQQQKKAPQQVPPKGPQQPQQKGPQQGQPKGPQQQQQQQKKGPQQVQPKGQQQQQPKGPQQGQPKAPQQQQQQQKKGPQQVQPKGQQQQQQQKKGPQQVQPKGQQQQQQQPKGPQQGQQKGPQQVQPKGPAPKPKFVQPDKKQFVKPKGGLAQGNVNQIRDKRSVQVIGGQRVIIEPGNRRIIQVGKRVIIRQDDSARLRRWGNARFEVRGRERYTIIQRGPYQIVTVTDANGRLIRRYRRYPNGREVIFIDNRRRFGPAVGVGAAALFLGLAAPAIAIPRNRYIVDAYDAPPALLYETLSAPPLMAMERPYTLDEVRYNVELRDRVRSIDLNTINFATGSWEITPDQYPQLQAIAEAILRLLQENPDAVVMVEGHTDAVGTEEDNLSLSDRRAEAVADILTGEFQIPPENLVTQGYGEQHLRVQTQGPSRENRRVQIRNITQLLGDPQELNPNAPPDQPPG